MFDWPERIEASLDALLRFGIAFVSTLWRTLARPQSAGRIYVADGTRCAKPYTYLAIASFVVVKVARVAIFLYLMIWVSLARSCSGADTIDNSNSAYIRSQLTVPSINEILLFSLPILVLVLLLSWVLARRSKLNPTASEAVRNSLSAAACYVVGSQYLFVAPVATVALVASTAISSDSIWLPLGIGSCILIGWPLWSFVQFMRGAYREAHPDNWRTLVRKRHLLPSGITVCTIPAALVAALAYPLAEHDIRTIGERPVVEAAVLGVSRTPRGVTLAVVLLNDGDKPLYFRGDEVKLVSKEGYAYDGTPVADGQPIASMDIPPNSTFQFDAVVTPSCGPLLALPSGSKGQIVLTGYSFVDGKAGPITANFRYGTFDDGTRRVSAPPCSVSSVIQAGARSAGHQTSVAPAPARDVAGGAMRRGSVTR